MDVATKKKINLLSAEVIDSVHLMVKHLLGMEMLSRMCKICVNKKKLSFTQTDM